MDLLGVIKSALEGRYALERQIGQGGMATVFLARDIRHERAVAIKVLNPELGAIVGAERFLAEIRVTAGLQHPNLLPLFDSGEADGQLFYVMPFVDGESLRDRLRREKQLPIDEAVRIAAAVGGALDYAHKRGVIHRDLKPENILLQNGHPLVADFGIALAVTNAGGSRITQTGLSLGTPHYMSPEQATGDRAIDGRTDIYSLAAVTYEMLTGDPPHTGSTAQAIIAKVLTEAPRPIRLGRPSVPPHVEGAVNRGLAKLPADRFATSADFVDALTGARPVAVPSGVMTPASFSSDPAIVVRRRRRFILAAMPWAIAGGALFALAASSMRRDQPRAVRRFLLVTPDSARFRTPTGLTITMSPDGQRVVYTGGPEGSGFLYLRELSELEPRRIRGTDRGVNPAFSPDGRRVLFVADNQVKVVDAHGGTATTLGEGTQPTWGSDGTILFVRGRALYATTASGQTARLVVQMRDTLGVNIGWPRILPGGKAAIVTLIRASVATARLAVVRLDTGELIDLDVDGSCAWYLPTGHLVFGRAGNTAHGVPFDVDELRVTGAVFPLVENVIVKPGGAMELVVADDGTMLYRSGEAFRVLALVDGQGAATTLIDEPRAYLWPRYSPDGRRIALTIGGATSGLTNDVWIYDRESTALTRLTRDRGERPEWSADGASVITIHQDAENPRAQIQPWDGSGAPRLYTRHHVQILDLSLPRRSSGYLAVRIGTGAERDILIAPLDSPRALRPFVATSADEYMPVVSPDGRWLAYLSDESGRPELYLRPLPGPGPRTQISTDGATEPAWSHRGGTLFYRGAGKFMAADLAFAAANGTAASPTIRRRALFDDVYYSGGPSRANYAVAPDDRHFLFTRSFGDASRNVVTLNWFEDVKARAAGR
jgi:serine/threonine-protein kinase